MNGCLRAAFEVSLSEDETRRAVRRVVASEVVVRTLYMLMLSCWVCVIFLGPQLVLRVEESASHYLQQGQAATTTGADRCFDGYVSVVEGEDYSASQCREITTTAFFFFCLAIVDGSTYQDLIPATFSLWNDELDFET